MDLKIIYNGGKNITLKCSYKKMMDNEYFKALFNYNKYNFNENTIYNINWSELQLSQESIERTFKILCNENYLEHPVGFIDKYISTDKNVYTEMLFLFDILIFPIDLINLFILYTLETIYLDLVNLINNDYSSKYIDALIDKKLLNYIYSIKETNLLSDQIINKHMIIKDIILLRKPAMISMLNSLIYIFENYMVSVHQFFEPRLSYMENKESFILNMPLFNDRTIKISDMSKTIFIKSIFPRELEIELSTEYEKRYEENMVYIKINSKYLYDEVKKNSALLEKINEWIKEDWKLIMIDNTNYNILSFICKNTHNTNLKDDHIYYYHNFYYRHGDIMSIGLIFKKSYLIFLNYMQISINFSKLLKIFNLDLNDLYYKYDGYYSFC